MKFTPEQLAKAKTCKSVEELLAYANEIGYPLTKEEAKFYFEQWNKEGEISDEELENVSGGSFVVGCSSYSSDSHHCLIVTCGNSCEHWKRQAHKEDRRECQCCEYCFSYDGGLVPLYCSARTADNDPLNSYIGGHYMR